jgi:hypothetical protein
LYHLQEFLHGQQRDSPQDTIQALDVVLRESPSLKYDTCYQGFLFVSFLHCYYCLEDVTTWLLISLSFAAMSRFLDPSSPNNLVTKISVRDWSVGEDSIRACAPLRWDSL